MVDPCRCHGRTRANESRLTTPVGAGAIRQDTACPNGSNPHPQSTKGAVVPTLHEPAARKAVVQLRADHFTPVDVFEISTAGGVLAATIAEVAHHQISEPGYWDCYGSPPDELGRLHDALEQMQHAIHEARRQLSVVERRARRRASRRNRRSA